MDHAVLGDHAGIFEIAPRGVTEWRERVSIGINRLRNGIHSCSDFRIDRQIASTPSSRNDWESRFELESVIFRVVNDFRG